MADAANEKRSYSRRHIWVQVNEEKHEAVVGITDYLAETIGNIIGIDMPQVDDELEMDAYCVELHLSKRIFSIRSPLTGRVLEINEDVEDNPSLLSLSPYKNWLYRMEYDEEDELDILMDANRYARFVDSL